MPTTHKKAAANPAWETTFPPWRQTLVVMPLRVGALGAVAQAMKAGEELAGLR